MKQASFLWKTYFLFYFGTAILPSFIFAQKINLPKSQQKGFSYHGNVHSPTGRLHILLIFVRYENTSRLSNRHWPNSKELPHMAKGEYNGLFNKETRGIFAENPVRNLSQFYHTMSSGKFELTGEIFPVQVPITYIPETRKNFFSRQTDMNKAAIQWIAKHYPRYDWSRFDLRTNHPDYQYDNSESKPDGVIDYVVFMHRSPGISGMGSPGSMDIPGTKYSIRDGHTGINSYADKEHNWQYFNHEFAHNLYNAPHYLGANKADGNRIYTSLGWGLMAQGNGATSFTTVNAWEKWWLGWLEPQTITKNGTYHIKDLVTGNDAIRIPIPGTQDVLWIENHQKIDIWDDKMFYNKQEKGYPRSAKGIYMYVVGDVGSDREKPRLNPFQARYANFIKMMNAEGNFDYILTGEKVKNEFFTADVFRKEKPNPIAGQNDFQFIRLDFDQNDRIPIGMSHGNRDGKRNEQKEVWAEERNGQALSTVNCSGDEADAFDAGDEVGLSGVVPVLNYPSFDRRKQRLSPFLLNGISIEIGKKAKDGSYNLLVKFDDWRIRENKRWCGNIVMKKPLKKERQSLSLAKKKMLSLEQSGTTDRIQPHPKTQTFSNPTHLVLEENCRLLLEKKSQLIITENSILDLRGNAELILEKGAKVIVKKGGRLITDETSQVILKRRAQVVIEPTGAFDPKSSKTLILAKGAQIKGI